MHTPEKIDVIYLQQGMRSSDFNKIIQLCKNASIRYKVLPGREIARLSPGNNQGVVARVQEIVFHEPEAVLQSIKDAPLPVGLALDQIQDTGNAGTLARTLYSLGGNGIFLPRDRSAFLGAGAQKASAGTLEKLVLCKVVNLARTLDKCLDEGFFIYAAIPGNKGENLYTVSLPTPAVILLGNEEKGVRPNVLKRATHHITIPMARQFNSLNVAQAGAIILSEFSRRMQC